MDLTGSTALVTGAGQGLGAAIARRFAAAGAAVAVHYRSSRAGAESVVESIAADGGRAIALAADLTGAAEVEALIGGVVGAFEGFDVLVNNAGAYPLSPLLELDEGEWDAVLDANLKSVHLCTRAAARAMIDQGRRGAIVNIASVEGVVPAPLHAHYTAAKAGVLMHTRAAAQELGPRGIRVNAVSPGLIRREGIEAAWPDGVERWCAAAPLGRMGEPEEIAEACLFLASASASWVTGVNLPVDGGILARPLF